MTRAVKEKTTEKEPPAWSAVKSALHDCGRAELLKILQDIYHLGKSNQSFLHARFLKSETPLEDYKARIRKSLFPDMHKSVVVAEAKRAIAEYRKAMGKPEDMLELHVFWCETASDFTMAYGYADEGYFNALLLQYELALKQLSHVSEKPRFSAIDRLLKVRKKTDVGYGVQDEMDDLLQEYGVSS